MAKELEIEYLGSFLMPNLESPIAPRQTLLYAQGPIAYRDGRLLIVGNRFRDAAWFTIPELDGTAEVDGEWFDLTFGKQYEYVEEHKQKTHKVQEFRIRGAFFDDAGLLHWSISAWYNVAPVDFLTIGTSDLKRKESFGMWGSSQFHSLEWGGYLCPLSPQLQKATGRRHGTAETIPQGSGTSNQGPSLFAFNMPDPKTPPGTRIESKPLIRFPPKAHQPYPGYYPSWQVRSLLDLPDHLVWFGRKGVGKQGYGYPEKIGVPTKCRFESKGYHSETYQPTMWVLDHASLLAGKPKWVEKDLSEWVKAPCAEVQSTIDPESGRIYLMESNGDPDNARPRIHVLTAKS